MHPGRTPATAPPDQRIWQASANGEGIPHDDLEDPTRPLDRRDHERRRQQGSPGQHPHRPQDQALPVDRASRPSRADSSWAARPACAPPLAKPHKASSQARTPTGGASKPARPSASVTGPIRDATTPQSAASRSDARTRESAGARASALPRRSPWDEEQARRVRLLLLGKGVVSAHRFDCPLAARLDETEQPVLARRGGGEAALSHCAPCSTSGADQRPRAAMSAAQRSPLEGGDDALRGYAGELTNGAGATRPTRSAATRTCASNWSTQSPLTTPAASSTHWSAGEAARMSSCPMTSRMAAALRTSRERSPTK